MSDYRERACRACGSLACHRDDDCPTCSTCGRRGHLYCLRTNGNPGDLCPPPARTSTAAGAVPVADPSTVEAVETAERAWREAASVLPTAALAPVRIGADKAREVDPRDIGSVLAVLRARAAGGAR